MLAKVKLWVKRFREMIKMLYSGDQWCPRVAKLLNRGISECLKSVFPHCYEIFDTNIVFSNDYSKRMEAKVELAAIVTTFGCCQCFLFYLLNFRIFYFSKIRIQISNF